MNLAGVVKLRCPSSATVSSVSRSPGFQAPDSDFLAFRWSKLFFRQPQINFGEIGALGVSIFEPFLPISGASLWVTGRIPNHSEFRIRHKTSRGDVPNTARRPVWQPAVEVFWP